MEKKDTKVNVPTQLFYGDTRVQRSLAKLVLGVSDSTAKSYPNELTFLNCLIAMLSTFLFGRSGIYKKIFKIQVGFIFNWTDFA